MKIIHIVCSYPPYYSGMGAVVLQTVHELGTRGHDVEVFTPLYHTLPAAPPEAYEAPARAQVDYARRFTPQISYGNAARISQIRTELADADIVHLHYPFYGTAGLVSQWKATHPEIPFVVTYHMDTRAPGWRGFFFKCYTSWFMPRVLGRADLLIGSSVDYIEASDAGNLYRQTPGKWRMSPFGVDTERFAPREKPAALLAQLGLSSDVPTVLFVGGMDRAHYFKGVDVLLKALLRIRKDAATLQALFVGDGILRQSYEDRAIGYGLSDTVRFLGHIDDSTLPSVYNTADLLVLPSTTRGEAFGMVLLEAMASGVPVISSDLPGVRTVAAAGGAVVPPGDDRALADAIMTFFSDAIDRNVAAKTVREIVLREYTWPHIVDQLESWYHELAGA